MAAAMAGSAIAATADALPGTLNQAPTASPLQPNQAQEDGCRQCQDSQQEQAIPQRRSQQDSEDFGSVGRRERHEPMSSCLLLVQSC